MNANQRAALNEIVINEADLQRLWNKPRRFNIPGYKRHIALVTMMVIKENDGHIWMSAIRVFNKTKNSLKLVSDIMQAEKLVIIAMLATELDGVGTEPKTRFDSQYAMHLRATCTAGELLGDDIQGAILGTVKPLNTNPDVAMKQLSELEAKLNREAFAAKVKLN